MKRERKFWFTKDGKILCSSCQNEVRVYLELTASCCAGQEYCYCDSPDAYLEVRCGGCGRMEKVPGATDRYGLERILLTCLKRDLL